jgi:Right handed beta helix region
MSGQAADYTVGHDMSYDYQTITAALSDPLVVSGDTILVSDGTYAASDPVYPETFPLVMKEGVVLIREMPDTYPVLDGEYLYRLLGAEMITAGQGTRIEGFHVTRGLADYEVDGGGGIYLNSADIVIADCIFTDNRALLSGGALYIDGSAPEITNCVITDNAAVYGAGIWVSSLAVISLCDISGNNASHSGGGLYIQGAAPDITECTILDNNSDGSGSQGGGVYCDYADPVFLNCTISGNRVAGSGALTCSGGGFYGIGANPAFKHCTVTGNTAYQGGGFYFLGSAPTFTNCIIWGNADDIFSEQSTLLADHCNIGDGDMMGETGTISTIPRFADAAGGDYSLLATSPCIDRGVDIGLPYLGTAPDMGAIESVYSGPMPLPEPVTVTVGAYGDFPTITGALSECNIPGSTLMIDPGTYDVSLGEVFPLILCGVSLRGQGDRSNIIIAGDAINSVISSGSHHHYALSNLTVTGGGNGGLRLYTSSPDLQSCEFTANTTEWRGGGIYCWESDPYMTSIEITGNTAGYDGAGLCLYHSSPSVGGCTITGNDAWMEGGGIFANFNSSPEIIACTISDNDAHYGGGIRCNNFSDPYIMDCTFTGNSAYWGGGFDGDEASPVIQSCVFSGNSSFNGGGLNLRFESLPIISNTIISENTAGNFGGGISSFDGSHPKLTNCLVTGNSAAVQGGGAYCDELYFEPAIIWFTNCTFTNNSSDLSGGGVASMNGSTISLLNCILWGDIPDEVENQTGTVAAGWSDIQLGEGTFHGPANINADPLFVPGPDGDLYLSQIAAGQIYDSPCLDSGSDPASIICYVYPGREVCLDEMTTRVDEIPDVDIVDMGFHYMTFLSPPTPTPTPYPPTPTSYPPTSTPTISPTVQPSVTPVPTVPTPTITPFPTATPIPPTPTSPPGEPTSTPYPTDIPTDIPTTTPTVTPVESTHTPVPTRTAVPSATATPVCSSFGCTVFMPLTEYGPGDNCYCDVIICNPEMETYQDVPVFTVLEVYGEYYFAPSFSEFDFTVMDIDPGETTVSVLPAFVWPSGAGAAAGIMWYAAMTDPGMTVLMGDLGTFMFGWHE